MQPSDKQGFQKLRLHELNIFRKEYLGDDTYVFYFERFFDFLSGQVVAIALREEEPARLYSICSGELEDEVAILFKIKSGGFLTPRLAKREVGENIWVSKAFGSFYGTDSDDYWIAAGTGIAPFVSMLKSNLAENKTLIHGGRLPISFYFSDLFENEKGLKYIKCSSVTDDDGFYRGRLTAYLKQATLDTNKIFFVCGSSEMVVQVRDILIGRGVDYDKIIAEIYF
jgi:ferredoxin--NADP+ reductase